MADEIEFEFVKFHETSKCKDPRSTSRQGGDTVQLTRIGNDGRPDLRIWKIGDTVFAKHLVTGKVVTAPWSNVRWSEVYVPQKAGAK